jgi:ribosome-associated protein
MNDEIWDKIRREVNFQAQRSRGPGGQNVNRTNSSVQLRWAYRDSVFLNEEQKIKIAQKLPSWISGENVLLIRSDVHRDQELNKKACLEKLKLLLEKAFFQPKMRKKTRPTYSSKLKNRESKNRRSVIKKSRSKNWD